MRILAIAGSLRARSSNRMVLEALCALAPAGIEIVLLDGIGDLPLFNADLDAQDPPALVAALRAEVGRANGLIICSPEYARGVSAVLKNLLEWLVASAEFPDKPVAVINASQRATDADSQLRLILKTMSARLIESACITVPMLGRDLDADGVVRDPVLAAALRTALSDFAAAIDAA
jgi:chromate reductase, NAD(P)H dehydrogenase (quinone)